MHSWVMTSCPCLPGRFQDMGSHAHIRVPLCPGAWWFLRPLPVPVTHSSSPCPDCPQASALTPVYIAKLQVQFTKKNSRSSHSIPLALWPFLQSVFNGSWDPYGIKQTNNMFIMMEGRPCLYLVLPREESISVHTCLLFPGFILDESSLFCFVCFESVAAKE